MPKPATKPPTATKGPTKPPVQPVQDYLLLSESEVLVKGDDLFGGELIAGLANSKFNTRLKGMKLKPEIN